MKHQNIPLNRHSTHTIQALRVAVAIVTLLFFLGAEGCGGGFAGDSPNAPAYEQQFFGTDSIPGR